MSTDREVNKEDVEHIHTHTHTHTHIYIHTMEYYSAIEKNEIMPFAATWMNLEIIILSKVRQRNTNIFLWYSIWYCLYLVVVVQSLGPVWLFATPWTAAFQASLSFTISLSLFKLMSIESVIPSNQFILCHSLLFLPSIFPSIRVSLMSQLFASGGQSTGVSASASVLLMNIQDWFPLRLTSLISLQSKGLSKVFSNTTV